MTTHIKHLLALGFSVTAEKSSDAAVEYKLYQIVGYEPELAYQKADDCSNITHDLSKAEVVAAGHVKWDGCSNWAVGKDLMLHACTKQELGNLGLALMECWDWTEEFIEGFELE